jgi:hypothetical protein
MLVKEGAAKVEGGIHQPKWTLILTGPALAEAAIPTTVHSTALPIATRHRPIRGGRLPLRPNLPAAEARSQHQNAIPL